MYIGTSFLQKILENLLSKLRSKVGARMDQAGIGPMPTPLTKPPPSRPVYENGDLHSLREVIRDVRELINLTDSNPRVLFNHLDFMAVLPYASREDWPTMIRKVKDDAFTRTLEAAMGTPATEDALVLQWETAWRARGHEKIMQKYIHPDLIPYLRHSVTHPALPFLRDHIIRMETIPWKVLSPLTLLGALVSFELFEVGKFSVNFCPKIQDGTLVLSFLTYLLKVLRKFLLL